MRIHLKIDAKGITIPFDHQQLLTGVIHKWIGWNEEHGNISLYSFSKLEGAKALKAGLFFEQDSVFFFSSVKDELVKKMIGGIQNDPSMFNGLQVKEIIIEEDPDLSSRELFFAASPIFIKRKNGEKIDHILYDDVRANACLEETLHTKMERVGISDQTLRIRFQADHPKAGTKKLTYNGVQNRASWCPVIIEGKPETKLFAWNAGLGNSTGIGFGAIK